jgi:hypothetical protein
MKWRGSTAGRHGGVGDRAVNRREAGDDGGCNYEKPEAVVPAAGTSVFCPSRAVMSNTAKKQSMAFGSE